MTPPEMTVMPALGPVTVAPGIPAAMTGAETSGMVVSIRPTERLM